jgi:predicted Zn-dependent protease
MTMLSREEAQTLLKKVLSFSKAEGCEANLNGNTTGNVRYARNSVSTAGVVDNMQLAVQSNFGLRSGTATINEFDDASLEKVVRRSEELAKLAPENPEFMPPLEPQTYGSSNGWSDATAKIDADFRARVAAASIEPAKAQKSVAAGYYEHSAGFGAFANSRGLYAYYPATNVNFSVTMRTEDGTGSGWVGLDQNDVTKLDHVAGSRIALDKAVRSREARAIEPGKYTVVLEPSASIDILNFMFFSMDRRAADEGRSFMSKQGGGNKLGEKLVDERVTIYSDPSHPDVPAAPWDGDGFPRQKTVWIEKGVMKNLFVSRYWAKKLNAEKQADVKPVPQPANGIMEGGTASTEDLIASTERGILVTRTWYIRMVDPQTVLVTGLTRDGTFMIENGKLAFPIKNMRFNESPIIMLNNLEALGKPVRVQGGDGDGGGGGIMVPPMKVRDFTFTSLSDAV